MASRIKSGPLSPRMSRKLTTEQQQEGDGGSVKRRVTNLDDKKVYHVNETDEMSIPGVKSPKKVNVRQSMNLGALPSVSNLMVEDEDTIQHRAKGDAVSPKRMNKPGVGPSPIDDLGSGSPTLAKSGTLSATSSPKRRTNVDDKKVFSVSEMPETSLPGVSSPRTMAKKAQMNNLAAAPSLSNIHVEDADHTQNLMKEKGETIRSRPLSPAGSQTQVSPQASPPASPSTTSPRRRTNVDDKRVFKVTDMPETSMPGVRSPRSLAKKSQMTGLAAAPSLSNIHLEDADHTHSTMIAKGETLPSLPQKRSSQLSGVDRLPKEGEESDPNVQRNAYGLVVDREVLLKEVGGLKKLSELPEYELLKSGKLSMRLPQQHMPPPAASRSPRGSRRGPQPDESELQRKLREEIGTVRMNETPEAQLRAMGVKVNIPGKKPAGASQTNRNRLSAKYLPGVDGSRDAGMDRSRQPALTAEEMKRKAIEQEIGGSKRLKDMPEFQVLANMGVAVHKPGYKAPPGHRMMMDGTIEKDKASAPTNLVKLDENGLPLDTGAKDSDVGTLLSQNLNDRQRANIAVAHAVIGVKNDNAWNQQQKNKKATLNEYLKTYEEYDLGVFPQMNEEELAMFLKLIRADMVPSGASSTMRPDPHAMTAGEKDRDIDEVLRGMQTNNYFMGTGTAANIGSLMANKYVLKEPVLIPAPYGEKWSMDVFALPHNALKRELLDLYKILGSLQRRMIDLRHSDIDDFYNWWEVFEAFILDYFDMEEKIVFPWIQSRIPLGKTKFSQTQRSILKGRLSKLMHDVDECEYKFSYLPAGEVLPRLLQCMDKFSPRLLEYLGEQERRLPRALDKKFAAADKAVLDQKLMDYMMQAKYTNELVTIMTRWLNDAQLKEWKRTNLKGTARLSYTMWKNSLYKNHVSIVTEMIQRNRDFVLPGDRPENRALKAQAEEQLRLDGDDELGLPIAKPGVPQFSPIHGKFGDNPDDAEDMTEQQKAERGIRDPDSGEEDAGPVTTDAGIAAKDASGTDGGEAASAASVPPKAASPGQATQPKPAPAAVPEAVPTAGSPKVVAADEPAPEEFVDAEGPTALASALAASMHAPEE
ncbi:hypothetical protein FVE85_0208 [Porphyridium purpureum]|uniref:Uncharacterized protein n=1 Tax=Porphyridium purpureum TaxID=35688 RepID=A0A5J4YY07_PORPP|nr:hypothetical protein FVE85_0208 [Porphyridium purpureum]|eukprot:POR4396..scf208_2